MGLLLAALAAAAVVAGVVGLVAAWAGTTMVDVARPSSRLVSRIRAAWASPDARVRTAASQRARWTGAGASGLGCWLVTGWLVAGVLMAAAVVVLPWLLDPNKANKHRITQLDAVAEWTKRLADLILLGIGIEEAIIASLRTAPQAIRPQVAELASRLQARWAPREALGAFADSLADATADKVAATLILRCGERGPGLSAALSDLAAGVAEEVSQRRKIEADRAKHRTVLRWITLLTLGVIVAGVFSPGYTRPYGTVLGQLVLALLMLAVLGVFAWMRALSISRPSARFLLPDRRSHLGPLPQKGPAS